METYKTPPNFIYTINHLTMHRQQVLLQTLHIDTYNHLLSFLNTDIAL